MEPAAVWHGLKVLDRDNYLWIFHVDIPQRSGLTMFVRRFTALRICEIWLSNVDLVIREALEDIESWQTCSDNVGSAMRSHEREETGAEDWLKMKMKKS